MPDTGSTVEAQHAAEEEEEEEEDDGDDEDFLANGQLNGQVHPDGKASALHTAGSSSGAAS